MNDSGIHRILHPTDLSEDCDRVYAHAVKVAALTGAALSVLHVHHDPDQPVNWQRLPDPGELLRAWGCRDLVLDETRQSVVERDAELGVVQGILDVWPNFLVVGTHGRQGLQRLLERSVAEAVSRRSGAVTLFVGENARDVVEPVSGSVHLERILVPVDDHVVDQQHVLDVVEAFVNILGLSRVDLWLLHCGSPESVPEFSRKVQDHWTWHVECRKGPVVRQIVELAEEVDVDLLVMASHGHDSLLDTLTGSRTEQVLRRVRCPVLSVPV